MKKSAILLAAILSFLQLGAQEQTQEQIWHTVKKGDTVNKICRTYGISLQELLDSNPSARMGLKRNTVLLIPSKAKPGSTVVKDSFPLNDTQAVKESSATDNPGKENSLKENSGKENSVKDNKVEDNKVEEDSVNGINYDDQSKARIRAYGNPLMDETPLAIGLALTLSSNGPANNNQIACLDFYSGFLLGLKNMHDEGLRNVTLNVYDVNKYSGEDGLRMPEDFEQNDIIIGPVRKKEIESVLPSLMEKGIPVISPFDPGATELLPEYRNLVQVAMSADMQDSIAIDIFCNDVKERAVKPIILFEKDAAGKLYEQSRNRLTELDIEWKEFGYTILQGRSADWIISSSIDTLEENTFFIASNSEAFVNDAVRNLMILSEKAEIKLFGLPKWKHFDTIDPLSYHKLKLSMPLQYWTDYNSENKDLSKLLAEYRAIYGCEPNTYVLQGYDIARYFIWYGKKYGPSFIDARNIFPQEDSFSMPGTINVNFNFERKNPDSGFENNAVREILYSPDLNVISLE